MCINYSVFMINYFLVEDDIFIDREILLVNDFINFKIKSAQSFKCAYRVKIYIRMFIEISTHTYISICVYTVFLKNMHEFASISDYDDTYTVRSGSWIWMRSLASLQGTPKVRKLSICLGFTGSVCTTCSD
jgi:hypothetical protein